MLNQKSIIAVDNSKFKTNLVKPLYESYCFSNIPNAIENIFCLKDKNNEEKIQANKNILSSDCLSQFNSIDNVVLFLLDGYGWKFFEKDQSKFPFLKRFEEKGTISKLTAQFPPTTVAEITTLNTGVSVSEHGMYEWNYYEPKIDDIIQPFLFRKSWEKEKESLKILPDKIFSEDNFYKKLAQKNIKSTLINFKNYSNSSYNKFFSQGAINLDYSTLSEGFSLLENALEKAKGKNYFYFYIDNIDQAMHNFGSASKEKEKATGLVLSNLEDFFKKNENKFKNTLILITADHGHINVDSKNLIYINDKFPIILTWIKRNKNKKLLAPAGGPRDLFLQIKDKFLDKACNFLKLNLADVALVYKTSELMRKGFWGEKITDKLKDRIGNLVILPKENYSVWWNLGKDFKFEFKSHHGGLTADEMEIPFLAVKI